MLLFLLLLILQLVFWAFVCCCLLCSSYSAPSSPVIPFVLSLSFASAELLSWKNMLLLWRIKSFSIFILINFFVGWVFQLSSVCVCVFVGMERNWDKWKCASYLHVWQNRRIIDKTILYNYVYQRNVFVHNIYSIVCFVSLSLVCYVHVVFHITSENKRCQHNHSVPFECWNNNLGY